MHTIIVVLTIFCIFFVYGALAYLAENVLDMLSDEQLNIVAITLICIIVVYAMTFICRL